MDVRELKDRAAALFAKRRFHAAAAAYARLIRSAPSDPRIRLRYAEACRRTGADAAAIDSYRQAAQLYGQARQWACARAALRIALELDATHPALLEDLQQLAAVQAAQVPPPRYAPAS